MNTSELRQSLGLIALGHFTRHKDVKVERSREALRSGNGLVMAIDQDGRQFQVVCLSETSDFLGDYEAMDANGQWRVCAELQVVE